MGLLVDDLAKQVLDQTRVVTNGPVLGPHEALHVDVVPGGGVGGVPVNDTLSLVLGSVNAVDALQLTVAYTVKRNGTVLGSGDVLRSPEQPTGTASDLLSVAFLLAPKVRLVKAGGLIPDLQVGLPTLDHTLEVTLTVTSATGQLPAPLTRTVTIPFTVATIEVPLPVPPAVCICAQDAGFKGSKFLVMLPPGSPESVAQIVSTYNSVLDAVNALEPVLSLAALVLKPLKLVVDTLATIPLPYVTTSARVQDFDDYDDFDDEMTSFLIVGPTGYGVRFNDTANPGDWDDITTNYVKAYRTIDLLQLPATAEGQYMLGQLGIPVADLNALAAQVAQLTGAATPADARLGIGVSLVHDLTSGSVPASLRHYDNDSSDLNDDTESALWITA